MNFNYFTLDNAEQFIFYRIPKILVTSEFFRKISDSSKLLYGLLLDRVGLSVKNNWIDEKGHVYIIYTIADCMESLNCATQKAVKLYKELEAIGLIERKKQGLNKPDLIYVKNFCDVENLDKSRSFENQNPELLKIKTQDFRKSKSNKNNINNTNNNDIENQVIVKSSHIENEEVEERKREKKEILKQEIKTNKDSELEELKKEKEILKQKKEIEELKQQINNLKQSHEEKKEIKIDDLHKYDFYKNIIKDNIDYDWIFNNFALTEKPNRETNSIDDYKIYKEKQDFIKLLDTFLDIMAEVMASNKKTIKINQEEIGQALVSKKFEQLTQGQIFFAVRQYQEYAQKTEVKYPKSYILTCLYNATTEQVAKDFTL